jgi:hypothetical protein
MRTDQFYLSSLGAVIILGFLTLAGCTQAATPAPLGPNPQSDSQPGPATTSTPNAEASSLSTVLNAAVDPAGDPLAALELPPSENSENLEFVTVYMAGGRKLSFATFPGFGAGYLDEHGYVWSKNLRQTVNGTYREAVNACADIGGILPDDNRGIPTFSADGKTELIVGLSNTEIPMQVFFYDYTRYQTYDGRTRKTKYSSTNSKDVLCIMEYKGRSK